MTTRAPATLAVVLGLLSSLAAAAPLTCDGDAGIPLDEPQPRVLLIGETHGTAQAPAFAAKLVCGLLAKGRPVVLALERDEREQSAMDRFLDSDGSPDEVNALLAQREWQSPLQDGRSSGAMLQLIDQARQWRGAGQPIELLMLRKRERPDASNPQAQLDEAMADAVIDALSGRPRHVVVALAGTFHTVVGSKTHRELVGAPSMGELLAARMPVLVIGLRSDGGEAWVCGPKRQCGPTAIAAGDFDLEDARIDAPVDLGRITASKPAKRP